jgi:cation:H+ antiporter
MSWLTLVMLIAGFVLLLFGAELLVRGASHLAIAFGISPLVVGLTVVSLGTSSPEISVSLDSALRGQGDIAIGNVVGSNTFNILFVLGVAALVTPLTVDGRLVRREVPIMIVTGIAMLLLTLDGTLGRVDGVLLTLGLIAFLAYLVRGARKERAAAAADPSNDPVPPSSRKRLALDALLIVAGLGLLVLGSRWLVNGAVELARAFGVSELIIGLTIIAAGTGLPEVATSVVAAFRGERDIAVGNAVGSNIFNILAVLGLVGLVTPGGVAVSSPARSFDIPVMVATCIVALPIFFSGMRIARLEGILFLGLYIAYVAYLVLDSRGHDALPLFGNAMVYVVLPVTVIIVAVTTAHSALETRRARATAPPSGATPPNHG